jgi:hypothetical protein
MGQYQYELGTLIGIGFLYAVGGVLALLIPYTYFKRNEGASLHNLSQRTTDWSVWTLANLTLSHVLWVSSLGTCIISTCECDRIGAAAFVVIASHMNLICDIGTVLEALCCGLIRLIIGSMSVYDWVCLIMGLIVGVMGMASSACSVGGQRDGFAHFAVGWVMWAVGTLCREWGFWA